MIDILLNVPKSLSPTLSSDFSNFSNWSKLKNNFKNGTKNNRYGKNQPKRSNLQFNLISANTLMNENRPQKPARIPGLNPVITSKKTSLKSIFKEKALENKQRLFLIIYIAG